MTAPRGLRATQRWFLDEVERAPASRRARRGPRVDAVVAPSATLGPSERVAIYRRMYIARLVEALENDFPVLVALLGHERFHRLVSRYVARHRPRSWTLNDLGVEWPGFLARERGLPRAALVRDVARVERAMSEAFDAEVPSVLRPADAARVPAGAWAGARLEPSPSLRLLALRTDANRVVSRVREGGSVPRTSPRGPAWVAVYRRDDRVWRLDLTRPMHAALSALVRGRTLAQALSAAGRALPRGREPDPRHVRAWFAQWIEEGLFAAVRTR